MSDLMRMSEAQQPRQASLPLDYTPALEDQMRTLFEFRWRRWHKAKSFEVAMQDETTKRLLALAVQHMPPDVNSRR
jgi:hypothetical protein